MKRISLIRHAKSDWNNSQLSDYYRPLNQRGTNDAPVVGKRLISVNGTPDLIISSGAVRALTTAKLFVTNSNYPIDDIKVNDNLYLASSRKIVEIIQLIDNQFSNVWLFSHNPGISETVTDLTDRDVELKTCCVANIELQSNKWRDFDFGKCEMKGVFSPKDN